MSRAALIGHLQRYLRRIGICAFGVLLLAGSGTCLGDEVSRARLEALTLAPVVKRVSSSVVTIRSWDISAERQRIDPEDGFPDPPTIREFQGAGVIVDAASGLIVTANHLVGNATAVEALHQDGRTLDATLVARSDRDDIALLQVTAGKLQALALAEPANVEVGEFVLAIGDPLNLGQSATFGIISALHRSCPGIASSDLIQSDALVGQGSSGGALVSLDGKLIGVVVARRGEERRGFAFAVPAEAVRTLLLSVRQE
jgi:S1-C subfamily serine protease